MKPAQVERSEPPKLTLKGLLTGELNPLRIFRGGSGQRAKPDYAAKRDLLEATFQTETGYRFTLMNAHFKSMRGGEEKTMPIRLDEAKQAAAILNRRFQQNPEAALMVMGDLNTLHHTKFGKPVLETLSLVDDLDPDNDLTETMLKDGRPEPTHRGGRGYSPSKLDYMYASKALLGQVRKSYVVGEFRQYPNSVASDHRPMVTVIEEPDPLPKVKIRDSAVPNDLHLIA